MKSTILIIFYRKLNKRPINGRTTKNNVVQGFILAILTLLLLYVEIFSEDIKTAIKELEKKETRIEAARKIEKIGKPAIKHLRQIIKDKNKDRDTKISSIILLGKLKAKEVRLDLEEVLLKDKDEFLREASAIALGNLDEKEAIYNLKKSLNDTSVNVRMRGVLALAKLNDKSGKAIALKTLIEEENVTGKLLATEALEAIGDKDVIQQLQQHLNDKNVWTRIYTKLTIKKLEMVGLSEQERLNFLKETLKDEQFEINQWAAIELAKIATPVAIDILKEAAKNKGIPGSYSAKKVLVKLIETGKTPKEELDR